jgi:hypothetical protein
VRSESVAFAIHASPAYGRPDKGDLRAAVCERAVQGKEVSFRSPVDIFAPAFIISGNRLRTPQASCRIRSVKPAGDRQLFTLDCANMVSANEVRVLMARAPNGSLRRYFNDQDRAGTPYQRCSR